MLFRSPTVLTPVVYLFYFLKICFGAFMPLIDRLVKSGTVNERENHFSVPFCGFKMTPLLLDGQ